VEEVVEIPPGTTRGEILGIDQLESSANINQTNFSQICRMIQLDTAACAFLSGILPR
jgi:hypothetical protein